LIRALRHMNDRDCQASIILGFLLFVAGLLDVLYSSAVYCLFDILGHTIKHFHSLKHDLSCMLFYSVFSGIGAGL
jgi:hypothetical protein